MLLHRGVDAASAAERDVLRAIRGVPRTVGLVRIRDARDDDGIDDDRALLLEE
jgi:hypothetical protein